MTAIIMREKSHELKEILTRALDIAEQMCEGEMGMRGGYGMRGGMNYRYPDYPMGMREDDMYGERRMRDSRGRYM